MIQTLITTERQHELDWYEYVENMEPIKGEVTEEIVNAVYDAFCHNSPSPAPATLDLQLFATKEYHCYNELSFFQQSFIDKLAEEYISSGKDFISFECELCIDDTDMEAFNGDKYYVSDYYEIIRCLLDKLYLREIITREELTSLKYEYDLI